MGRVTRHAAQSSTAKEEEARRAGKVQSGSSRVGPPLRVLSAVLRNARVVAGVISLSWKGQK